MKGKKPNLKMALLTIFSALILIVALSYLGNAFSGVFGRSTASVKNTDWISFNQGKISFADGAGTRTTPEDGSKPFSFEETEGVLKCVYDGGSVEWYTRFSTERLTSQDGLTVFYLFTNESRI